MKILERIPSVSLAAKILSVGVLALPAFAGDDPDPENTVALEPGGFLAYPPGMDHFAYFEGETVIQLNCTGPWTITYVRDEDDPRG